MTLTLGLVGCRVAGASPPVDHEHPGLRVEVTPAGSAPPVALPADDPVWPLDPPAEVSPGWTTTTIRHLGVHVEVALPPDATVTLTGDGRRGRVLVQIESTTVVIEHSSTGMGPLRALFDREDRDAQLPYLQRISRNPYNTTTIITRGGMDVIGWVRGAVCMADDVEPPQLELAFELCASVRVPRPGPLVPTPVPWSARLPSMPAHATIHEVPDALVLDTGHFTLEIDESVCPSERSLRRTFEDTFGVPFEPLTLRSGPAYLFRDDPRTPYPAEVTLVVPRGERCCAATMPDSDLVQTEEQVEYMARICDAVPHAP